MGQRLKEWRGQAGVEEPSVGERSSGDRQADELNNGIPPRQN